MTSPRIEKERQSRDRESTARGNATDGVGDERPVGIALVAALVGVGGLASVFVGFSLFAASAPLFGGLLVSLGAFALYVAHGLLVRRVRALGWAIFLHGIVFVGNLYWVLFESMGGGSTSRYVVGVAVSAIVIVYLLSVAEYFG